MMVRFHLGLSTSGIVALALAACVPEGPVSQGQSGSELVVDECVMNPALGVRAEREIYGPDDPKAVQNSQYKIYRAAGEAAAGTLLISHLQHDCFFSVQRSDGAPLVIINYKSSLQTDVSENTEILSIVENFYLQCQEAPVPPSFENELKSGSSDFSELVSYCQFVAETQSLVVGFANQSNPASGIFVFQDNLHLWSAK